MTRAIPLLLLDGMIKNRPFRFRKPSGYLFDHGIYYFARRCLQAIPSREREESDDEMIEQIERIDRQERKKTADPENKPQSFYFESQKNLIANYCESSIERAASPDTGESYQQRILRCLPS